MSTVKNTFYVLCALLAVVTSILLLRMPESTISAVVLPHHDLVAAQRQDMLANIAVREQPDTILLLSPNHYNLGAEDYQTRQTDFTTKYGTIPLNTQLHKIARTVGATDNPATFMSEHGIISILPDIKEYFPNAQILPIIVKTTANQAQTNKLIAALAQGCSGKCMLIASVDFSHYQPYPLGELHDSLSVRSLKTTAGHTAQQRAEVDAPNILAATIRWAKLHHAPRYIEYNHTNSNQLSGDYYIEGTTHEYGWFEQGEQVKTTPEVTFAIAGNMMFDRGIRNRYATDYTQVLSQLGDRVLWGTDLVLANLEGSISADAAATTGKTSAFRSTPQSIRALNKLHLTHLLNGGNTPDISQQGKTQTAHYLQKAGITPLKSATQPTITENSH